MNRTAVPFFFTQLVHGFRICASNGHVERRGQARRRSAIRAAGQRHGDHDALPHTAGQLVRILLGDDLRVRI